MASPRTVALAALLGAIVGGALGAWVQSRRGEDEVAAGRERGDAIDPALAEARRERDAARSEVSSLRRDIEDLRRTPAAAPVGRAPAGAVAAAAAEPVADAVRRLEAEARSALARGDGNAALAAIRDLAGRLPDGRGPAMALTMEIDPERERLGIGDLAWGGFLASPAVLDLLSWSLGRPAPEGFREMAAEWVPHFLPASTVIERFREALLTEDDEDVARSMVEALDPLGIVESSPVLLEVVRDARMRVPVRVHAATLLSEGEDAATAAALREVAAGAPTALAEGIRAALSAPEMPERGFLVTGFVDGSTESRGILVGDLLATYDGRDAARDLGPAIRAALERDGFVPIVLLRAGARRTIEVRPGWLGLIGRTVRDGRPR
jgi:hypothetical protein